MRAFLVFVIVLFRFLDLSFCYENTYKTAIVNYQHDGTQGQFNTISASLKQMGVDLIMLMPKQSEFSLKNNEHCAINNFDELIDSTSKLAIGANSYVVMESVEKSKCYDSLELFKTNIMIDRNGRIISMLKIPVNKMIECNTTVSNPTSISTDFGVRFDIITVEDILTRPPEEYDNKHYIVVDSMKEQLPFFTSNQLLSSLSRSIGINLYSKTGVYGSGVVSGMENGILIADIEKEPVQENLHGSAIYQSSPKYLSHEDLKDYVTTPIDLKASVNGLSETICHNKFCCEFYVKTGASKQHKESNYSLVVFDGVRNIGGVHYIGVQNCAVIACKGLYKRSCFIESSHNTTSTTFENIRISANFSSENTMQLPATLTTAILPMTSQSFNFDSSIYSTHKRVSIQKGVTEDLLVFGIFGRDYSKDFVGVKNLDGNFDFYDYVFNEDVIVFFDYAWIRIKVLLVIVTLYVLEQM